MREKTLHLLNAGIDDKFDVSIRPSLHFQHLTAKVPDLLPRTRSFTVPSYQQRLLQVLFSPHTWQTILCHCCWYLCYAFVLVLLSSFCIQLGKSLTYTHLLNMLHGGLLVHSRELIIKNPNSILGFPKVSCCVKPGELNCPKWCSYPKKQEGKRR